LLMLDQIWKLKTARSRFQMPRSALPVWHANWGGREAIGAALKISPRIFGGRQ